MELLDIEINHDRVVIEGFEVKKPAGMSSLDWMDFWTVARDFDPAKDGDTIDEVQEELKDAQNEIDSLEERVSELESEVCSLEDELSGATSDLDDANNRIRELEDELNEARTKDNDDE
jgi:peptidoglycan hydrolase CwlO-like protein